MNPFRTLESPIVTLPRANIDTDQIIPARFLTTTERAGLGRCAFYDWRFDANGAERTDSPLNDTAQRAHRILVAGRNFGCGSSREHAPWALLDFGFQAVISSEIADIFRSNALKNGLVAVVLPADRHAELLARPGMALHIDVEALSIRGDEGWECRFELDAFARRCLLMGVDQLGYLVAQQPAIEAFEASRLGAAQA